MKIKNEDLGGDISGFNANQEWELIG